MARAFAFLSLACLSVVPCIGGDASPTTAAVPALVAKLGDPSYAVRESASRELLKVGTSAMVAIQTAIRTTDDLEIRTRCEKLAAVLQRRADTERLLPQKLVKLDYQGVPIAGVVNDLKRKTGIDLVLHPSLVADASRKIDLTDGEVPIWKAVERLCEVGGLSEMISPIIAGSTSQTLTRTVPRVVPVPLPQRANPAPVAMQNLTIRTIVLVDGQPQTGSYSTASPIRVRAVPASAITYRNPRNPWNPGDGFSPQAPTPALTIPTTVGKPSNQLYLDVTAPDGVAWQGTRHVRVTVAEDQDGRPVFANEIAEKLPPLDLGSLDNIQVRRLVMLRAGGGMASSVSSPTFHPRLVPVTFQASSSVIKTLKRFEGVVVGTIGEPNQPVLAIDDLTKSAGKKFDLGNSHTLTVTEYTVRDNGGASVKVLAESRNFNGPQFRGGDLTSVLEETRTMLSGCQFRDSDGKLCESPNVPPSGITIMPQSIAMEFRYQFGKPTKTGPPVKLVLTGTKYTTVEVPFQLKDVRLP